VINRAYFVYSYVIEELTRLSKLYPTIKWLGLASGSAWPVLEGVAYFRHHINSDIPIELTLVDMDDDALEMAKKIAAHLGIADVITCVKRKIDDFLNESTEEYHGIEIFGFFDYKPGAKISAYCRKIRKRLKENGVMLAALICPSPMPWAFNVEYIVGWPLLRRRKLSVVKKIILDGGSREDEMLLEVEPCRVHALVRCYKRSSHQERLCP
jgi:cyclopropane fatty-acyl-phospholipid synthase-like methyltransferase